MNTPFYTALIIPTGIGASIGGYGGDAMTLLPLLASICDGVITHPNVANAACFQTLPKNTLYVEGYALDRFFQGQWHLKPQRQNRIGIIMDSGITPTMKTLHHNTIHGTATVYGLDIVDVLNTAEPVQLDISTDDSGRSCGTLKNPHTLLHSAQTLIAKGATALAVCCRMPSPPDDGREDAYKQGQGVDPIGGLEAMISHYLVSQCHIPVAHAPVFDDEEAQPVTDTLLDPKAAAEFIVPTFLPCVLTGLAKAPQYTPTLSTATTLCVEDVSALIVPADALGALPVLAALERHIPILAIANNTSVMNCQASDLGRSDQVTLCQNYLEALGHCIALKEGITLPPHILANAKTPSKQAVCL